MEQGSRRQAAARPGQASIPGGGSAPPRAGPASRPRAVWLWLRRAVAEFLGIPMLVIAVFVLLAAGLYVADDAWPKSGAKHFAVLEWLGKAFEDSGADARLLGTVASSMITVTSITFSLLLLAVQQGAAAFSNQVFDQFLRRRANQFYFSFFVGLSVYSLVTLTTTNALHHPVFGTLAAVVLTAAPCMMIVLLYSTVDQMRSAVVVRAIHDHAMRARDRQLGLLARTRRSPRPGLAASRPVEANRDGVVTGLDVRAITAAAARAGLDSGAGGLELAMCVEVGEWLGPIPL